MSQSIRCWLWMTILLGCIADDASGGTDVALTLARTGMDVVQALEVPTDAPPEADAIVISLKTRTSSAAEACERSDAAARYLLRHGASQLLFKYCSTFDSTHRGNIGPVADALLRLVGSNFTIFCPAFPANGRTVRDGRLFVHGVPLQESSMRDHPLTPMRSSDLVELLAAQSPGRNVGLVPLEVVERGLDAVRSRFDELLRGDVAFAIVDSVNDEHLITIAGAASSLPLLTGASGIAFGVGEHLRTVGRFVRRSEQTTLPDVGNGIAVLSGSCSETTRAQVAAARADFPVIDVDPLLLADKPSHLEQLRHQALEAVRTRGRVVITSTAGTADVNRVHQALGIEKASALLEDVMATLAVDLVGSGVRKLIAAGGETSSAIARALGIRQLRIGPEIDPGVPWTITQDHPEMLIAFKSGNFGSRDFFRKAAEMVA